MRSGRHHAGFQRVSGSEERQELGSRFSPGNTQLPEDASCQFSHPERSVPHPASPPWTLWGGVKVSRGGSSSCVNPCRGRGPGPVSSWPFLTPGIVFGAGEPTVSGTQFLFPAKRWVHSAMEGFSNVRGHLVQPGDSEKAKPNKRGHRAQLKAAGPELAGDGNRTQAWRGKQPVGLDLCRHGGSVTKLRVP